MRQAVRGVVALLAGLLLPLGLAPYSQPWAPVLGLAVLFALLAPPRTRALQVAALSYLFGLGYAGFGVYWIHHSIAHYGGGPLAAGLAITVLVALFALIPMTAMLLGWWAGRRHRAVALLLAFPAGWVFVEWVRSWLFTGATWLSLGYSQVDTPLAAFAPVFGVYGSSAAVALLAGGLAWWLRRPLSLRLLAPVGLALGLLGGGVMLERDWSRSAGEPVSVAMIQGSIAQSRKWDPAESGGILAEYVALTRQAFGADLIVWPETAVPALYHQAAAWLEDLAAEARAAGSTLVVGTPAADQTGEALFNAVAVPGATTQFYYKRHLVPFGEYVPFRDLAGGLLDFVGTPLGDFRAGVSAAPLEAAGLQLGVSICYEITFGTRVAASLPAAEVLLNVSNDAWFGHTAAPWQHLQMARMRAIETGRPVIRATNTGVSALIDGRGKLLRTAPLFEPRIVTGTVVPRAGTTPYMQWRDAPMAVLAGVLLLGCAALGRRRYQLFRPV